MKRAFTLIEVNLAILIMAGGILSVVVLYSLGFRESSQSREDICSSAYADGVLSPLVAALSSSTLTWRQFDDIGNYPDETGWGAYINEDDGTVKESRVGQVDSAMSSLVGKLGTSKVSYDSSGVDSQMKGGIIVRHKKGEPIVRIGFRASKDKQTFLSAPVYYTEVAFQGIQEGAQ